MFHSSLPLNPLSALLLAVSEGLVLILILSSALCPYDWLANVQKILKICPIFFAPCCTFWSVNEYCALQMLVEISFFCVFHGGLENASVKPCSHSLNVFFGNTKNSVSQVTYQKSPLDYFSHIFLIFIQWSILGRIKEPLPNC